MKGNLEALKPVSTSKFKSKSLIKINFFYLGFG